MAAGEEAEVCNQVRCKMAKTGSDIKRLAMTFVDADRRADEAANDRSEAEEALEAEAKRLVGSEDNDHCYPVVFATDRPEEVVVVNERVSGGHGYIFTSRKRVVG